MLLENSLRLLQQNLPAHSAIGFKAIYHRLEGPVPDLDPVKQGVIKVGYEDTYAFHFSHLALPKRLARQALARRAQIGVPRSGDTHEFCPEF